MASNHIPSGLEVHVSPPDPNDKFVSSIPRKAVGGEKPDAPYSPISSPKLPNQQNTNQIPYYPEEAVQPNRRERNVPCGFGPVAFAVLVALITSIIVGSALGGGLGASLASAQARECSQPSDTSTIPATAIPGSATPTTITTTATVTTTATGSTAVFSNYAVLRPTSETDTVALNCDQDTYKTIRGQTFNLTCGESLYNDDIGSMVAYVVDDCIEACSNMNYFQSSNVCIAITFNAAMYQDWYQHANCWFKSAVTYGSSGYSLGGMVALLAT